MGVTLRFNVDLTGKFRRDIYVVFLVFQ